MLRFTISRASDKFMTVELPNSEYSPHPKANWSSRIHDWILEIEEPSELIKLCDDEIQLIISKTEGNMPHIEIDDVTLA